MSERDELLAIADAAGFKIDKRQRTESIREVLTEAGLLTGDGEQEVTSRDWDNEPPGEPAADEAPVTDQPADPEDGWPQRIAPCAWLDQDGNRHTDMGAAYEAAERIRRRS